MQIDYLFMRQMVNAMIAKDSHYINIEPLAMELRPQFATLDDEEYIDKFYGHLWLLKDNSVIEEMTLGQRMGISYATNRHITRTDCVIRLTAQGYDFAKLLNKNDALDKIKKMSIASVLVLCQKMAEIGVEKAFGAIIKKLPTRA
ncbi:MAG: hypothetical protein IJ529_02485 [Alphaproteobacteria bacterium]|nr:hypothetical protein [Alphaproteobacteria bacterium]MBR1648498.1 hypothetical protein [Alphaproteobacteria bacterium]